MRKLAAATSFLAYITSIGIVYAQNVSDPGGLVGVNDDAAKLTQNVPQLIINYIFYIAMFLAVVYLMYGGIKWMTSGGDKVKVESARKHIISATIGLVVVVGTFLILRTLGSVLGVNLPIINGKFTLPTLRSPNPT